MTSDDVTLEIDELIATVTLNCPPLNLISIPVMDALHKTLDRVEKEKTVRSVILTGAGDRAFCGGANLRLKAESKESQSEKKAYRNYGRQTLNRIEQFPRPMIAAIHGYCIGAGTGLGWSCDIRIAADNTVFRAADAYLGLIPSWGMGLLRLPRWIGRNSTLDLLLLGRDVDAVTAMELGLVTAVVPRASLQQEAKAAAARIAEASPQAILAVRKVIAFNLRHSWDDAGEYEEQLCEMVSEHPDAKEGPVAFREKRPPRFRDIEEGDKVMAGPIASGV